MIHITSEKSSYTILKFAWDVNILISNRLLDLISQKAKYCRRDLVTLILHQR